MNNVLPPLSGAEIAERFADIRPPLTPQEAVVEANRCLFCFDAPCTNACPTHIDVPRFIRKIAAGNLAGSARAILEANVLALSCSRVCPVDVLCEGACVLHRYNKHPIEIGRLQRHAMDHFYTRGGTLAAGAPRRGRVACIGGGPASLACAARLRERGIAVTIFEARPMPGGLNTYGVAEYKFRPHDSAREVELVRALGAELRLGVEVDSFDELERDYDVVFVGVGLGAGRRLGIPGEDLPGVVNALRFIADYKTGGSVKVGRRVVVIGGGNTAIDAAVAARRLGASQAHVVYRRGEEDMSAFRFEYEHAIAEGVVFHWHATPKAVHGNGAVEGIECARDNGTSLMIACDMVIPAIGQSKLVDLLARARGVELRDGCIVADPATGRTANPRYYAGGDCVNGGREVVDAVADGQRAAAAIARSLEDLDG
jgi:dihydropyrimidine dehydrogenase (NAD+) subunit PreT